MLLFLLFILFYIVLKIRKKGVEEWKNKKIIVKQNKKVLRNSIKSRRIKFMLKKLKK